MEPIGVVRSPYTEKFGIPRQPGLAPSVRARVELDPRRVQPEALRGLSACSHVWLLTLLHAAKPTGHATVRPPRLGGNIRLGALATRSPFRPNPIGLSAVALVELAELALVVAGADLLDGTPVLDIKPYVPYCDAIADARCDWARAPAPALTVTFSPAAARSLADDPARDVLRAAIVESLRWDPRPAYRRDDPGPFAARMCDVDVRFQVRGDVVVVEALDRGPTPGEREGSW